MCCGGDAASKQVTTGETIFLITTLRSFGYDGLEAALRTLGRLDEVTLVDQIADASSSADGVVRRKVEGPSYLPASTGLTSLTMLAPRVRYAGTLVETVHGPDAENLLTAVEKAAGVNGGSHSRGSRWQSVSLMGKSASWPKDSLDSTAYLLKLLAQVPQCRDTRDPFARQLEKLSLRGLDRAHALTLKEITFSKLDQIAIR